MSATWLTDVPARSRTTMMPCSKRNPDARAFFFAHIHHMSHASCRAFPCGRAGGKSCRLAEHCWRFKVANEHWTLRQKPSPYGKPESNPYLTCGHYNLNGKVSRFKLRLQVIWRGTRARDSRAPPARRAPARRRMVGGWVRAAELLVWLLSVCLEKNRARMRLCAHLQNYRENYRYRKCRIIAHPHAPKGEISTVVTTSVNDDIWKKRRALDHGCDIGSYVSIDLELSNQPRVIGEVQRRSHTDESYFA